MMADFLLEILCEEIPARMQSRAVEDFERLVLAALSESGLGYSEIKSYVTPRRLALCAFGLPLHSPDVKESKKGPRVDAPQQALEGFMRGSGITSLEEAEIVNDAKKGDFYQLTLVKPGRATQEILAELIVNVIENFPWAKSMRWGQASQQPGALRWVRPINSIMALLDKGDGKDSVVVACTVGGVCSGNQTMGHRFMAGKPFRVRNFADYCEKLREHYVILDSGERLKIIAKRARVLADEQGLEIVEDTHLLAETAGLVEWPVVLMGAFDESFLDMPDEVIRTSIRVNQKSFVLKNRDNGQLANHFILVANIEARDGGEAIVAGNEKVVRARLSDAQFFWQKDKQIPLQQMAEKLNHVTFHAQLGTQYDRIERMAILAGKLADITGADHKKLARAVRLCKADLVSDMVGEFPELQGVMGRAYAQMQGEAASIADAIGEHYRPQGAGDELPVGEIALSVALADKLDMLMGFWSIDELPTGSRDPYALRRAALGVLRIVLERRLSLPLMALFRQRLGDERAESLLHFFCERLKVLLRDDGIRYDIIDAVLAMPNMDDFRLAVDRIIALQEFLVSDDGNNLLIAYRRVSNILRDGEKERGAFSADINASLLQEEAEQQLDKAVIGAQQAVKEAIMTNQPTGAMRALAGLRLPLDNFFAQVLVNVKDEKIKINRLNLLKNIQNIMSIVADFEKIESA